MPIIYIHGVKVRSPAHGVSVGKSVMRWLAPEEADAGYYIPIYWGDLCADEFRWNLQSRPRTELLGHGAGDASHNLAAAQFAPEALLSASVAPPPEDGNFVGVPCTAAASERLAGIPVEQRADLLADLYLLTIRATPEHGEEPELSAVAAAAAKVGERWEAIVAGKVGDDAQAEALLDAMDQAIADDGLLSHGGGFFTKAGELLRRAVTAPGDLISTVAAEGRPAANEFVATFFGDVLTYLHMRDNAPNAGPIVARVIDGLKAGHARALAQNEPLIVMTHSMGGQLFYDTVTHFAGLDPVLKNLKVAHWISFGSQVSFFAELGLFKGQPGTRAPDKLPKPVRVAKWTNFYDTNDPVGFRMSPVFSDVTDKSYDTGYGLALAHTGYLARPSFYDKIASALGN